MPCRVLTQKFLSYPRRASQGIFDIKKKKKPLEPRFTRVRTRFILEYHSVRAWMLQGKEVRATRRSVSGGRKIDIATRTLGYSVNDDKRLPRTITADNGKNHCWKRGVGIPLQGDVAKNKRPWRKRNSEIRENKWKGGRERGDKSDGN